MIASEPLRLGVLGCGKVFERFHLPSIDRVPAVALVAAHDIEPARLVWSTRRSPPPALFHSTAALVRSDGLEALLVLAPPAAHADAVVQALEAGLHVLVEKPMALEPEDGRRMLQAARAAGRKLQVGFSRRFREPYQRLQEMLSTIERSEIRSGSFELSFPSGAWKAKTDFLGHETLGGDALHDVLSHQVDLVCWLLGPPEAVRARITDPASDRCEAELRFATATVRCLASHSSYVEHLELQLADGRLLEASGSAVWRTKHGLAAWRRRRASVRDQLVLIEDRLRGRPNVSLVSFERQLRDFVQRVRGGQAQGASGEDGLRAVEIVHTCRLSAREAGSWQALRTGVTPVA